MKIVFLHGLGQRAADWDQVASQFPNTDCPELFQIAGEELNYSAILSSLEERYEYEKEPLCLCGLSLGGMLALDYALRHGDQVAAMVLLGARDRTPRLLMDIQDLLFRCMPDKAFASTGMKKEQVRDLTRSMKNLDFTDRLSTIHCPVTVACGEISSQCPTLCCPSCRTRVEYRCPGHRGGDSAGILPGITLIKIK